MCRYSSLVVLSRIDCGVRVDLSVCKSMSVFEGNLSKFDKFSQTTDDGLIVTYIECRQCRIANGPIDGKIKFNDFSSKAFDGFTNDFIEANLIGIH